MKKEKRRRVRRSQREQVTVRLCLVGHVQALSLFWEALVAARAEICDAK